MKLKTSVVIAVLAFALGVGGLFLPLTATPVPQFAVSPVTLDDTIDTLYSTVNQIIGGLLSTSTTPTQGHIAYWTGTKNLGSVATSSVTISSPLTSSGTAGAVVGGSSWALGCQNASGAQAGCLSSSDWTTFNSKESTLSFTFPLQRSGNTISWGGISTSSAPTQGQVTYWTGANALGSVATGTVSAGTGISISATIYALLNAASIAIDQAANLTWTGAHDFGGATSLEIPNGSSPTVDAIGEIGLDTTANQLLVATSTTAASPDVYMAEVTKGLVVSSSTLTYMGAFGASGSTTLKLDPPKRAIKITDLACDETGNGTSTVRIGSGTASSSFALAGVSSSTRMGGMGISIAARSPVWLEFGTLLGTPGYWSCNYTYLYDRI